MDDSLQRSSKTMSERRTRRRSTGAISMLLWFTLVWPHSITISRAVPNILFSSNSRPNSVFVFGRIVMQKTCRIWITSTARSLLVVPDLALDRCCLSPCDALWHFLNTWVAYCQKSAVNHYYVSLVSVTFFWSNVRFVIFSDVWFKNFHRTAIKPVQCSVW